MADGSNEPPVGRWQGGDGNAVPSNEAPQPDAQALQQQILQNLQVLTKQLQSLPPKSPDAPFIGPIELIGVEEARKQADLKAQRNEQTKLTANFLNGLALACVGTGALGSVAPLALGTVPLTLVTAGILAPVAIVAIGAGYVLHRLAKRVLRNLRA